ncbi:Cro/CI family transcriptional regulator [Roseibium suaedae]|uniref:Cro/CI family transcriptional regulator n=1 Tax=Roseibium suaedae TaxID=735517 RepID=UPI0009331AD0|nr:Cro/CI family transcriptional regulator [Roseibium suaedae]
MIDIQTAFRGKRGLIKTIADELGITHGAVSQWKIVPALRVLDVERITGLRRSELRPDLYPPERCEMSYSQDLDGQSSRNLGQKSGAIVDHPEGASHD